MLHGLCHPLDASRYEAHQDLSELHEAMREVDLEELAPQRFLMHGCHITLPAERKAESS